MKKIKLFMMLALLVVGVSNVWAATKDFYVNYEREFIGGGYSINNNIGTYTIQKFSNISGLEAVGDRMIRVTYSDYSWSAPTAAQVAQYITAKAVTGYTTRVVGNDNTIYICYIWSEAYSSVSNDGTINLNNTVLTQHEWTSGHFTYSDLYQKTDTRRIKNVIKLPANQCAVRLNIYTDREVTILKKDPTKKFDVVAIQTHGMDENVRHSIYINPSCNSGNTYQCYNDWSNSSLQTVTFEKASNVRSIGDYAFCSCKTLTTIEIPQSVEYLGEACFSMCVGLRDGLTFERTSGASFTTGIKVIRNYTFWMCQNMTSLELPDNIIVIEGQQSGSSMQYMVNLSHLRLPNTLVAIGPHFLCDASSLTEVSIPASVKYIDGACFHGCESLQKVFLLGPASALQGVYDGSDTFDANPTLCKDNVSNCVFITTQDNIEGYAKDTNEVWQLIADNRTNCRSSLRAVKVDEDGEVVRNAAGELVYETDENGQPVYLKYPNGTEIKPTACGNGWGNALTYLPDQKVTFTPGKWVTVIFPKAYSQAQLQETFGTEVVLAKMTGFQSPESSWVNGKLTYHLNFTAQTNAEANVPYMIKPGQKNGTNPYDVTMIAANEMNEDYRAELTKDHALAITASDNTEVVMYGWFKKINKMKLWEFYFKNPLVNGQWNTNCQFKRITDVANAPAIKAFRCYWRIWLEGEAQDATGSAKSGFFTFVDDETTAIEQPESNISIEIGNIYDLNGRKLDVKKEDLPKGLFIIDGKKVMVK